MGNSKFPIQVVISAIDQLTAPLKKINSQIRSTVGAKEFSALGRSLSELGKAAGIPKVAKAFGELKSATGDVASEFGGLVGKVAAFAGIAGAGLTWLVKSAADAGDTVANLAIQTGFSKKSIQELDFAAGQMGGSTEDMNEALLKFSKGLGQAQAGTGKLSSFLKEVSPKLLLQVKGAKSSEEAFGLMMNAINKVHDPARKMALAVAAFGPAGKTLIEMANSGAGALDEQRKKAQELGVVMSDDVVDSGKKFNDVWKEAEAALLGVRNMIGAQFIPVFTDLLQQFIQFVIVNKEGIAAFATSFAAAFRDSLPQIKSMIQALASFFLTIDESGKVAQINMFNIKLAIGALVAIMVGPLLASLVALVPAIITLGTALIATPIGWAIAGLTILAGVGLLIYKNWDGIAEFFGAIGEAIVNPLGMITNFAKIAGNFIMPKISGLFGGSANTSASLGPAAGGDVNTAATSLMSPRESKSTAAVQVSFANLPRGARVQSSTKGDLDFGLDMSLGPMTAMN